VEEGRKARPEDAAYRIAGAAVRRWEGRPALAAAELIEAAPADGDTVGHALDELDPAPRMEDLADLMGQKEGKPQAPEWSREDAARLSEALARVSLRDPRVKYQTGRALGAAGRKAEAQARFAEALEACADRGPDRPPHPAALRTAFQLSSEEGPEGWVRKCVDVIMAIGKDGGSAPMEYLFQENKNPIARVAREHLERKEWLAFYRLSVEGKHLLGFSAMMNHEFLEGEKGKECIEAIRKEVYRETDARKYAEFADFLATHGGGAEIPKVLEKAREKAPEDADILERLAKAYTQNSAHEAAAKTYRELLKRVKGPQQVEVRLKLANSLREGGDAPAARGELAEIDLKALKNGTQIERVADACGEAEDWDRALAACRRACEVGRKPHFRMGRFLEKKGDFLEAIRYYNRDIAEPASRKSMAERMREELEEQVQGNERKEDQPPRNAREARERLLKKLGPDYLTKRFLERTFEPLPPAAEEGVKAASRRLASDSVTEREEAYEALRKAGPNAAPLLRPLLNSSDGEVQNRVKQLFAEWAEPR